MKAVNHAPPPEAREMVAYADLLDRAHGEGLKSIQTQLLLTPNDENGRLCIVKATVEVEGGHFEGIGDADPGSVEERFVPHLIRVAETRAKARALRDAVNCGVVSFEELDGAAPRPAASGPGSGVTPASARRPTPKPNGRTTSPRDPRGDANGHDGPMSEAQRRYLFRLLAGQGYAGAAAEEFLRERLGVQQLTRATRHAASALIDELLQSSAPERGGGNGAASHAQR